MEREETLVNSFDEDSTTLMPNSTSALQEEKKLQTSLILEHRCTECKQNLANQSEQ